MEIPQKPQTDLLYDPVIPLLGTYSKKYKSAHKRDTCIQMHITALVIRAKLWKQPRCSTNNEWINKIWYGIHIFTYM
jgi:hypothetical protein